MCTYLEGFAQQKDTLYRNDDSFEDKAIYGARDSLYIDLKGNKIHLYGEAHLEYMETNMKAGYILVDLNKKEVFATYLLDKDSTKIEVPHFQNGAEEIIAERIRYNFETEKGYIEEVKIKQDEIYLAMGVAKRQQNGDIHFRQGRFTTCELDDPHYHFQLSKAVMVPDKRIVTGPMNLWVKGVPTPLGLPFSYIPQAKNRSNGLLFPQIVPLSGYGFGVRDLGYFFPINDRVQTSAFITLFNRGSWGIGNKTDYYTLYKRRGSLNLSFQQLKAGFPSTANNNKLSLAWTHQKDQKSNPFWSFSSNVNFVSDNNTKNNLDPINSEYFNNQLNSDINLQRFFPGKPINMGLKLSLKQNTINKSIGLTSPIFTTNVTRFFPLKNIIKGNKEWQKVFSQLAVSYNFEGQNRSTFSDTLLKSQYISQVQDKFLNGIQQSMTIQTSAGFFRNTWKLNPSINYSNRINFQTVEKSYDTLTKSIVTNLTQRSGTSNELSFNASLTTVVYSYYRFVGKKKPLLRHILTPSFGLRYSPDLNGYSVLDTGKVTYKEVRYSPFEQSMYNQGLGQDAAYITFGFNNTFELKTISAKDTLTGFKKTKIIDAFSLSGNYNVMKDSMNWSDIGLNLRMNPVPALSFVASSNLSPYDWSDSTGAVLGQYAIQTRHTFGRLTKSDLTTSYTITSKESQKKLNDLSEKTNTNWNSDYAYFALYPERIVDFDIPWKISFSHVYSIVANQSKSLVDNRDYKQTQTLSANGDVSFTKRWKLVAALNFDFETAKVTNTRLTFTRDMHCWALSFNWTPIGNNQSFLFSLRSTASMFSDAKLDLRKPPLFF